MQSTRYLEGDMHRTIESAIVGQYVEDRIRDAGARRLARNARRPRPLRTGR
jgi:hypothetical protein